LRLLLDTHVLLWWMELHPKLGARTRDLIEDTANEPILSIVSLWEIAVKIRAGKLKASIPAIVATAEKQGFSRLGIEDAHLHALLGLPMHHRDPFDHLLIAQAIAEDVPLLTVDRAAERYAVKVVAAD
jgi:PIN domain nuclease of toxin-antitoxin system